MGILDWFARTKEPPGSPHYRWVCARIAENARCPAPSSRATQDLVDALRALQGGGTKGVFGMATGALAITEDERKDLQGRLGAALLAHRDALADARDIVSLFELSALADPCGLPDLRLTERPALRCDPLGDPGGLPGAWPSLVARLRAARDASSPLRWDRVAESLAGDEAPKDVRFGAPDGPALYAFALRYEHAHGRAFPRELAAVWSVVDGIQLDGLWWFLSPVSGWAWDDVGLRVGDGQSVQGRLCLAHGRGAEDLAVAEVLDLDDDGDVLRTYPNLQALLDLLLP